MAQLFATGIYTTLWALPFGYHPLDIPNAPAGLGKRNLLILQIKSNLRTGYYVKGAWERNQGIAEQNVVLLSGLGI